MDNKFIETSLAEIGNIDDILSRVSNKELSQDAKDYIASAYNKLFHKIDAEVKSNAELNGLMDEVTKMIETLNYDVKDYFTYANYEYIAGEDVLTSREFDEQAYQSAQKHVESWKFNKEILEDKLFRLEHSALFKIIRRAQMESIQEEIKKGDERYEHYKKIFDEASEIEKIDKNELTKNVNEKSAQIQETLDGIIDKNILEAIKSEPSLVAYDVFVGSSYPFISSSTDENCRNVYNFFDSREINKKLSEILKAYNKQKEGLGVSKQSKKEEFAGSQPGEE